MGQLPALFGGRSDQDKGCDRLSKSIFDLVISNINSVSQKLLTAPMARQTRGQSFYFSFVSACCIKINLV